MVRHHPLGLPDRGQVVRAVPLLEHGDISRELCLCLRVEVEAERLDAPGERPTKAHAVRFSELDGASLNPRLRCTSRSEIAAGVTPEIRAAWPSVSGRC